MKCRIWSSRIEAGEEFCGGKPIRVVIVKENDKTWLPLMSTDVEMSVVEILESYAVRFGIEEMFKDSLPESMGKYWFWQSSESVK